MEESIFIAVLGVIAFFGFVLTVAPQPELLKFARLTLDLFRAHFKTVACLAAFLALVGFLSLFVV